MSAHDATIANPVLFETTRGDIVENRHRAAVAVADASGEVVAQWGDIGREILPRSSIKMLQALPLIESGAADAFHLTDAHLALACASHDGAPMHTRRVADWLSAVGIEQGCLRCGAQPSRDRALRRARAQAARIMNNCSGKHAGFLTLSKHCGHPLDAYLDPASAVQSAVAEAFSEMTGTEPPLQYGIDGCSAPNFAAPISGIARAMAQMAAPDTALRGVRADAARRLLGAMRAYPLLISGVGRACAALIEATDGAAVVKTGADGVFAGALPAQGLGFCLKVDDSSRLAAEGICAALLIRFGVLDPMHPTARRYVNATIRDLNRQPVGVRRAVLDGPAS